jgi:hypothetical protein
MLTVPVPKARSTVAETLSGLEVRIPARKSWSHVLFTGFWMVGWAVGETFAVQALVTGKAAGFARIFLLAWVGGWTVAGAFIGRSWLWTVFGVEKIVLRPGVLNIKRDIFGTGRNLQYDLTHVKNLRVSSPSFNPSTQAREGGFQRKP